MTPALTQNLPLSLKNRYAHWPVFSATFDELLSLIDACPRGEVLVGRLSPPRHTAYLIDHHLERLVRCVQDQPMRVVLRRRLANAKAVQLLGPEEAA